MRRVAITGASGLLGTYVAKAVMADADVVGVDIQPPALHHDHFEASIVDLERLALGLSGADCVLHIAAAANISAGPPETIMALNVTGTWNVLEAALRAGVRRVILCSSDSVMRNTVWKDYYWCPDELPVDEEHPVSPVDPYGLSKFLSEEIGQSYSRRGLEVLALRPVFILFPAMMGEVLARNASPRSYVGPSAGGHVAAGGGICWHHIDPRDVAEAFRLAMRVEWQGYEAFYLCAPSTLHPSPTLERLMDVFGRLPDRIDPARYRDNPFAAMFDTSRAEGRLGWTARYDHRPSVFSAE